MRSFLAIATIAIFSVPNAAIAVPCPGAPTSTLGTVNYDPLATSATTANFTLNILSANVTSSSLLREASVVKQVAGNEDEGVAYSFDQVVNSSLPNFADATINGNATQFSNWRINGARVTAAESNTIPANQSATGTFKITIPAGQNLTAGPHAIEYLSRGFWWELINTQTCPYGAGTGGSTAIEVKTFTLNVQSSMSLNMTGGGVSGLIDFDNQGGLSTNAKRAISVRLRSNLPYKISMSSANNGYLNLNNAANATEKIAYSATLNGTTINATTPYVNNSVTGTGGANLDWPFEVTIGNTANARAGFYKDVITLTIGTTP